MDKKTGRVVAAVLGTLGLLFIFAGPAFHFIDTTLGIFLALASWAIGGLIAGLSKGEKGEEKKEEPASEKEEKEEKE